MTMQLKSLNVNARQPTSIANRLRYALVWKQRKLMVQCVEPRDAIPLPSLTNVQGIVACLERSPVQLVKLDPALGAEQLHLWATACQQAHKPAFLCLPPLQQSPQKQQSIRWRLKRLFDQVMAVFLLLLLSPVWFSVMLLVWRFIPGSIFVQEYRVGARGKLFQMLKFRTTMGRSDTLLSQWRSQHMKTARTNVLGRCLERYSLDELPQLINILRGEMSLVGLRPLPLDEAVKVPPRAATTAECIAWYDGHLADWRTIAPSRTR